jgi:hypothetical protein
MNTYNFLNGIDNFEDGMRELYGAGIKRTYDGANDRVILFSERGVRRSKREPNSCFSECNGYIFDVATRRPLCIPLPVFETSLNVEEVNRNLGDYTIYYALDGTAINLYYWGDSWRLSTAKGYDVSDMRWNSKETHREMLHEILTKVECEPNSFYDLLDKQFSYTFVIKHPNMHQFWEGGSPIYSIHYIQSANLETFECFEEVDRFPMCHTQKKSECGVIEELFPRLTASIENSKNGEYLYGFIVRSSNGVITLLESYLLRKIRSFIYEKYLIDNSKKLDIPCDAYTFLYHTLNPKTKCEFLRLFPQFTRAHNTVLERVSKLARIIERMYKGEKIDNTMALYIYEKLKLRISSRANYEIINNFILHRDNIVQIYTMLSDGI